MQQRPHVRHDAGLLRQPVARQQENEHHRLSGRHAGPHQPTRWSTRRAAPVPSSGLCTDPTSPLRNGPVSNLLSAIGIRVLIGARRQGDTEAVRRHPRVVDQQVVVNVTARTVERFRLRQARSGTIGRRSGAGDNRRRLPSGGVRASLGSRERTESADILRICADMPGGYAGAHGAFNYYAGSVNGTDVSVNRDEAGAARPGLESHGVQPEELHDISDQMSRRLGRAARGKWVMFYGGD